MTANTARRALLAAIALGVAGDLLLDATDPRLGFALWVVLIAAAAAWQITGWPVRRSADAGERTRAWLLLAAAAAVTGLVLRDAEVLNVLDVLVALAAAGLAVWRAQGRLLRTLRLVDGPLAGIIAAYSTATGAIHLTLGTVAPDAGEAPARRRVLLSAIGAVAALPVFIIVAALLGEADPIFGLALRSVTDFIAEDAARHVIAASVFAWIVAGWLRGALVPIARVPDVAALTPPRVAMAALAPALHGLSVLLTAFLGLQARALFGGAHFVERTAGLSYAEYARGGFFELVAVAFVVMAVLLVVDALLDRDEPDAPRRLQVAGGVLLVLLAVLGVSALHRMTLYVRSYGLSEERILAIAGLVGIAAALAWFAWTVLRGRGERFVSGLVAITGVWVLALNLLNADALTARVNLSRAQGGAPFDIAYHSARSADAVPALVAGAHLLAPDACRELLTGLRARWADSARPDEDWRSWSLPRARARALLSPPADELIRDRCASRVPERASGP
jgi:hypothetical protein